MELPAKYPGFVVEVRKKNIIDIRNNISIKTVQMPCFKTKPKVIPSFCNLHGNTNNKLKRNEPTLSPKKLYKVKLLLSIFLIGCLK